MGWCGRRTPDRTALPAITTYGEPEENLLTGRGSLVSATENSGRAGG